MNQALFRARNFTLLIAMFFLFNACSGNEEKTASAIAPSCSLGTIEAYAEGVTGAMHSDVLAKRFIVKHAKNRGNAIASDMQGQANTDRISEEFYRVQFEEELTSNQVAKRLNREDYVYIEPDFVVSATLTANDEKLNNQWAHEVVQSAEAWDISIGSTDVIVGILDSGVDYNHPDLAGNIYINPGEVDGNGIDDDGNGFVDDIHGWNFVANNNNPMADDAKSYHGTHVAGTVGAVGNNEIGVSGHAQVVRLLPLKFLGSGGSGYTSDAIKGIDYAISRGAKIINNSWGGSSRSQALSDAIDRAQAAGILFTVAAGNSGRNNDTTSFYPANYPQDNVVSVASTTNLEKLSSFSNYGPSKVHIGAPGSSIYSTRNGNAYAYLSGTSMATPLVSGVLATMAALRPDLNYLQLKSILLQNVDVLSSLKGKLLSEGRINAARALAVTATAPSDIVPTFPPTPISGCP